LLPSSDIQLLNNIHSDLFFTSYTADDAEEENYDEKGLQYHHLQLDIVNKFKERDFIDKIQSALGVDLRLQGMTATLVDITGTRPQWIHVDDPKKLVTIVIYL
jgi:hypothetical protein